jgi:UDPglucose--hexose-1-phosphate uridylyltransferase
MAGITKRVTRLSDGRELIYFDDADTALPPERAADTRPPAERPALPELRQDPLTGEWISIAAARQHRAVLPPADLDPLAPSAPGNPTELPADYDVAVFENRSPSFGPGLPGHDRLGEAGANGPVAEAPGAEAPDPGGIGPGEIGPGGRDALGPDAIGLGRSRPGYGRCEVICFGPQRSGSWADFTVSRARTVVEAWADRTAALSRLPGVRQVYVFENRGAEIGVTLHHPHGQVYGYPFITPRTSNLLTSIASYGPSLMADILRFEASSERLLIAGEHFTVFVPFAARWPVEVHMLPHRDFPDLAAASAAERDEIALLYPRVLRALDRLYDTPTPYIAAWHQAPVHAGPSGIRLMLQVTSPRRAADKLKYPAGSETGMGAFIGDIAPEAAAARLRDALARTG